MNNATFNMKTRTTNEAKISKCKALNYSYG